MQEIILKAICSIALIEWLVAYYGLNEGMIEKSEFRCILYRYGIPVITTVFVLRSLVYYKTGLIIL